MLEINPQNSSGFFNLLNKKFDRVVKFSPHLKQQTTILLLLFFANYVTFNATVCLNLIVIARAKSI